MSYQCQPDTSLYSINAKPMGAISARMFQQEPNYSLTAIKSESQYQLSIFLHVRLELGLNSLITSYI